MLDLTSYDHRRGIVILTSKDMRVVSNNLFDWKVHTGCIESHANVIESYLNEISDHTDGQDKKKIDFCLNYIDSIKKWIKDASEDIDKAREIFR